MWCKRQVIVHREGFRVPAVLVRADLGEDTEICASGVRWVAVRVLLHAVLIISAHLPHARQSVMSKRETLQEITCCLERFKSAFPRHNVVLGADCNASLNGVRLTKVRSCADAESASALYEFMLNFGLRADNTWSEWDCVTRVGWRHENRESQVDYLFSSQGTFLLDVWVDSSLVCDSDHLAVVGTYQTVRNAGVSGTGKKKRIPCALRWTANDPVAWRKLLVALESLVLTGVTRWFFLVFLARRKCEKDQVICDLKAQLQCATTTVERRRCNRLLWRRRRALARQKRVVFLREACEAKRSPVQRKRGNHFHWLRVFRQEPPSSATRSFYADIFEITVPAERELQLKAKNERILERRRPLDNGSQEIEVSQRKASPDGVTAEMLLALLEEQIVCLARNIQNMFSSLNFQETWFRVMASLVPKKKHIREVSTSFVPSVA